MATTGIALILWFSLDPFASGLTRFCLGNEDDAFPAAEEAETEAEGEERLKKQTNRETGHLIPT